MKKTQSIVFSAFWVSVMVTLFKVIGFIKQAVVAYYFGATASTDSYFISNAFITGVTDTIINSVGVSIIACYLNEKAEKGRDSADKLVSNAFSSAFLLVGIICCIGFIFAPHISMILVGDNSAVVMEVAKYIRILLPVMFFTIYELTCCSILDANNSFFTARLRSVIYSLSIILSCILLSKSIEVFALVVGQYASRVIYATILFIVIRKYSSFTFIIPKIDKMVINLYKTAVPLIIGNGVVQLNKLIDNAIAARLSDGIASSLNYCHVLEELVTAILISNICAILFSKFAQMSADGKNHQIIDTMGSAIKIFLYLLVPISIVTAFCAEDIVAIVYYRGSFSAEAVTQTSLALLGYGIAFPIVGMRELFIKGLYAKGDTKHPMISSIICMLLNVCLSVTLSRFWGIFGISFATSVSAVVGLFINEYYLYKKMGHHFIRENFPVIWRVLLAAIITIGALILINKIVHFSHIGKFIFFTFVCFTIYSILLIMFRAPDFISYIKRGLNKLIKK